MQSLHEQPLVEGATAREIRQAIKKQLPKEIFQPRAGQLWYLPAYASTILACAAALRVAPGWAAPLLSLVIGCAIAGLGFLGHNLIHNSVVRGLPKKAAERLVWALAFTPATGFIVSHNRVHHRATDTAEDFFRYFAVSEKSRLRTIIALMFYPNRYVPLNPLLGLSYGFFSNMGYLSALVPPGVRFPFVPRRVPYTRKERVAVALEILLVIAVQYGISLVAGPGQFLWTVVVPMMIASAHITTYGFTQHSLHPLSEEADPIRNTSSLRVSPIVDFLHLNLSRHVAHHLFETVSSDHYPMIDRMIKEQFPESYHEVDFRDAVRELRKSDLFRPEPAGSELYPATRTGTLSAARG